MSCISVCVNSLYKRVVDKLSNLIAKEDDSLILRTPLSVDSIMDNDFMPKDRTLYFLYGDKFLPTGRSYPL